MGLNVDTSGLRAVSPTFAGAEETIEAAIAALREAPAVSDPHVRSGLEALVVAVGGALEVVAEGVAILSTRVGEAAGSYEALDSALAAEVPDRAAGDGQPR